MWLKFVTQLYDRSSRSYQRGKMKLMLKTVILSSFIMCFQISCGGSVTDDSRFYSFSAESFKFVESESGSFVVLSGLSDSVEFNYPLEDGGSTRGAFDLEHFVSWWDHLADDERLSLTTESITVELADKVKTFVLARAHSFHFYAEQNELMIGVELIGVEQKHNSTINNLFNINPTSVDPPPAHVKFITSSTNPSPGACNRRPPPDVPGLEWKWVDSEYLYNSDGADGPVDVSIYTVRKSLPEGFYALSDLAVRTLYPRLVCGDFVVRDVSPEGNLITPPAEIREIATSRGDGGHLDLILLDLIPRDGYRCLGVLSDRVWSGPHLRIMADRMACLHESILEPDTDPAPFIWYNSGTGGHYNMSLWRRGAPADVSIMGPFIAVDHYGHLTQRTKEQYYYRVKAESN